VSVRFAVVISDEFLRRLMPSLATLAQQGTELRIIDVHRSFAQIRALLEQSRPAGVITEWIPGTTEKILELGFPTVIADTDYIYQGAVSIDVDDIAVGATAAEYFLGAGYQNYAFVGVDRPYSRQRLDGFRDRLRRDNQSCTCYHEKEPRNRHYMEIWQEPSASLREWLQRLPKPIGIFAAHDPLGRLICEAGREAGISIPEEIAVLGANNDELVCALSHPPLSSIEIPWNRIGSAVSEWIHALGKKSRKLAMPILFPPGGVKQRQSTTLLAVEDDQLRRALQYLREKFPESISIEIMCQDLRISRRSIERRFVELLKATPWDVLSRMRVDRAKTLLVATDQPISIISEKCGFADPERFAVVFRRYAKMSPSQFRKASQISKHP